MDTERIYLAEITRDNFDAAIRGLADELVGRGDNALACACIALVALADECDDLRVRLEEMELLCYPTDVEY